MLDLGDNGDNIMVYDTQPDDNTAVMTIDEFVMGVAHAIFTDDSGFGYLMKDGKMSIETKIYPSTISVLTVGDATHIGWFNK